MRAQRLLTMAGAAAGSLYVKCISCGVKTVWNTAADMGWIADLDGVPFEAYYCPACAEDKAGAEKVSP